MPQPRLRLRHVAGALATAWVGRWALRETAARVARRLPPRPLRDDASRAPGHMPGPFDR